MVMGPEFGKSTPQETQTVQEVPESPSVPETLVEQGVSSVPSTFTAQVQDDNGQNMIVTPQDSPSITITAPASPEVLKDFAKKGDTTDSATWNAMYFLYMIQKALHFGWKIVSRSQ